MVLKRKASLNDIFFFFCLFINSLGNFIIFIIININIKKKNSKHTIDSKKNDEVLPTLNKLVIYLVVV